MYKSEKIYTGLFFQLEVNSQFQSRNLLSYFVLLCFRIQTNNNEIRIRVEWCLIKYTMILQSMNVKVVFTLHNLLERY